MDNVLKIISVILLFSIILVVFATTVPQNRGAYEKTLITNEKSYDVYFFEMGLPNNTNWSVTMNNTTRYSTSNYIVFSFSNGTYRYTVNSVKGYYANTFHGTVSVKNSNVSVVVYFQPVTSSINYFYGSFLFYFSIISVILVSMVIILVMRFTLGKNDSLNYTTNVSGVKPSPVQGSFSDTHPMNNVVNPPPQGVVANAIPPPGVQVEFHFQQNVAPKQEYITCPRCGYINLSDRKKCDHCGETLSK
ncbi:MAG: hypothetical protein ACP5RS_03035 [Thermoplasmata archaeon]